MPPSARPSLPPGRHFTLTWAIPDDFGGLTSAMLHRSRAFVEQAGVTVDILTLDPEGDYPAVEARLRREGRLVEGMRLRNLWDDLRQIDERALRSRAPRGVSAPVPGFEPLVPDRADVLDVRGGSLRRRTRLDSQGAVRQTDHYRADGSLLVSDRRSAPGSPGTASVTLCDRQGRPSRWWSGREGLYHFWLDRVTRGPGRAWLVNDSQFIGGWLHRYQRRKVVVVQIVHNTHLAGRATSSLARLSPGKAAMLRSAADFDALVFLTHRQATEAAAVLGPGDNREVVPNSRTMASATSDVRDRAQGVLVGRLSPQKRIDHAVRAVALARDAGSSARLKVLGEGTSRESLTALVEQLGVTERVVLAGHSNAVADELAQASFSVLSSQYEGFGLVLVESMAAGCVPIAYDIRYGPADIITHRVDGLLVTPGDTAALAEAVQQVVSMPQPELAAMRAAGRARAGHFSDPAVVARWAEVLSRSASRKRLRRELSPRVARVQVHQVSGLPVVTGEVETSRRFLPGEVFLVLRERGGEGYVRRPAFARRRRPGRITFSVTIQAAWVDWLDKGVWDVYLEVRSRSARGTVRLPAPPAGELSTSGLGAAMSSTLYATKHDNLSLRSTTAVTHG